MKRLMFLLLLSAMPLQAREVKEFDAKWRFALGDPKGADAGAFDDSSWRLLDVPHDWAFEADYAKDGEQTDKGGMCIDEIEVR